MFQRAVVQEGEVKAESTFVGEGTTLNGTLTVGGPARIEGRVEGQVQAGDTLTIGETGVVEASITGTTVIVHGQVTGDITVRTRLELHSTCRVRGNISAPTLVIHEGAMFVGQCAMGDPVRMGGAGTADKAGPRPTLAAVS